jgi:sigma-E factor negative regulatory protein RseA
MKMSKETREHLSALVDGEISLETSRFLVRRLGTDDELRATWTRYHLIRDCLRHQDGSIAGEDLCARVGRALESEQPVKHSRPFPTGWLKPVAGLAIAASVALMAIVAIGPGMPGAPQAGSELAGEVSPKPFVSPQSFTAAPYSSQVSGSESIYSFDRTMNPYLLRHYQAAGSTGGNGFVKFVPIVIIGSKAPVDPENNADAAKAGDTGDAEPNLR